MALAEAGVGGRLLLWPRIVLFGDSITEVAAPRRSPCALLTSMGPVGFPHGAAEPRERPCASCVVSEGQPRPRLPLRFSTAPADFPRGLVLQWCYLLLVFKEK